RRERPDGDGVALEGAVRALRALARQDRLPRARGPAAPVHDRPRLGGGRGGDRPLARRRPRVAVATAILYDVHGNLAALEAAVAEAERAGATDYVLGGDYSTFGPWPREPQDGEERLLAGESGRTILFGHSHVQFRRPGPDGTFLINPGSVGMPLDGDTRAAWALYEDEELGLRRTEYDVEPAAAQMRTYG